MTDYKNIIRNNPDKRTGKPCVRDTKISVYDVLGWLATGMENKDIKDEFPQLTDEDIRACQDYVAAHEHRI